MGSLLLNSHDMTLTGIGWVVLVIVLRHQAGVGLKAIEEKNSLGFRLPKVPIKPVVAIAQQASKRLLKRSNSTAKSDTRSDTVPS